MARAQATTLPPRRDAEVVDAALVERWMLKTITNMMFDREIIADQRWKPNRNWVECAFGLARFAEGCGMYLLEGEADALADGYSRIGIRPLLRSRETLIGGQFKIEDVQFAITMERPHQVHTRLYRVKSVGEGPVGEGYLIRFDWTNVVSVQRISRSAARPVPRASVTDAC